MKKHLSIIEKDTGEVLEEKEFDGGYHIIYSNNSNRGELHHIRKLENAKFGSKHWIKTLFYRPIAQKLIEKFDELKHINVNSILFLEDMDWSPPENPTKPKPHWMARMKKTSKELAAMTGYEYILETRNHFIEMIRREQLIALIYHELRHIDQYGDIQDHDIKDWNNLLATLGTDWAETEAEIINILEDLDSSKDWNELSPIAEQITVFKHLEVVK